MRRKWQIFCMGCSRWGPREPFSTPRRPMIERRVRSIYPKWARSMGPKQVGDARNSPWTVRPRLPTKIDNPLSWRTEAVEIEFSDAGRGNGDSAAFAKLGHPQEASMPIRKGDRLIFRNSGGLRCKAVADEDNEGMVMTKQKGGAFCPCPAVNLEPDHGDLPVKSTDSVEVVARRSPGGVGYWAIIKDKVTGIEKTGAACPGDPDDFKYNEVTDTWSVRS